MNKTIKFIGIIALMAVIVFTMTACGEDGGGGEIPVKVRAYNNNGIAPVQAVTLGSRSPQAIEIMPLAADTTFAAYTEFYGKLGTHVRDITPSKFVLGVGTVNLYAPNGEMMSVASGIYDFAQGVTASVGEIEGDVTCAAMSITFCAGAIAFHDGPAGYSYVEFEWPMWTGTDDQAGRIANFDAHLGGNMKGFSTFPPSHNLPAPPLPGFAPTWNGNKVSVSMSLFEPYFIKGALSLSGATLTPLDYIIYGAGSRRMYINEKVPTNSVITGLDSLHGGMELGTNATSSIVIPFTPINVPSSASSVTFDMSWNLDGIISQYRGADDIADTDDDIFVLKDGWWNGLYMTASVQ